MSAHICIQRLKALVKYNKKNKWSHLNIYYVVICDKEDTESLLSWFAHSCSSKRSGVQVKGGHSHSIHSSVSIACNDRLDNPPTTQRVLDASIGFLNLIETSNTYLGSLCSFFFVLFFLGAVVKYWRARAVLGLKENSATAKCPPPSCVMKAFIPRFSQKAI